MTFGLFDFNHSKYNSVGSLPPCLLASFPSKYNIFVEDIMVRRVKFLSSHSTYRELINLLDSTSLKTIPLVDSRGRTPLHPDHRAPPALPHPHLVEPTSDTTPLSFPPPLESMILLGSIERTELQGVSDWWLSAERRVFEKGQGSGGQGVQPGWESFAYVDEEEGEEIANKVSHKQI